MKKNDELNEILVKLREKGELVPIREEFQQWDFDENPIFVGTYLDMYKEITPSKGEPFYVFGFRSITDDKIYGLGGAAINRAVGEKKFVKGKYYVIDFVEKVVGKNGRTFRRFNIYETTENILKLAKLKE